MDASISKPFRGFVMGVLWLAATMPGHGDTTIDPIERYAWMPNAGWVDFHVNPTDGAQIDAAIASGHLYAANIGWIYLGDGRPDRGTQYFNDSAQDHGVNVDSLTDPQHLLLSGYAWAPNVGWINFSVAPYLDLADRPRIERTTGRLTGFVWSANLGWIRLDPPGAGVVTSPLKNATADWTLYR